MRTRMLLPSLLTGLAAAAMAAPAAA
ncbi:MAG: hypothetical protein QOI84_535, partial [Solirubrobacterales bacterium]|nr:hypothetical protein [Solirubrobacterales bacterium]